MVVIKANGDQTPGFRLLHNATRTGGYLIRVIRNESLGILLCYVGVSEEHRAYGQQCDEVAVHGGVTFAGNGEEGTLLHQPGWWWIGWDYGHAGDATNLAPGRTWTVADAIGHAGEVINQLEAMA